MNRKNPFALFLIITSTAIAIASGVLVLAGYFLGDQAGGGGLLFSEVRLTLLNWAVILAGFALFIGVLNLVQVHLKKVRSRSKGAFYSLVLVFSLIITFLVGLVKPTSLQVVFTTVQLPVEASLMALLAVTLTYASIRLLNRRRTVLSFVFLGTALLMLLATAPLPWLGNIPILSDWVRPFIAQVLAASGARGILIGVALGTLTTGLRVLLGVERPYGGEK